MNLEKITAPIRDMAHLTHCFGQLAIWGLQDILITVDDAIVELPDE